MTFTKLHKFIISYIFKFLVILNLLVTWKIEDIGDGTWEQYIFCNMIMGKKDERKTVFSIERMKWYSLM